MAKPFLTKDAPVLGERRHAEVKFRPASDLEMKAIGDNLPEGYVAGWASTPDLDFYAHVVTAGAFDASIRAKGLTGPKGIKLLIGHDRNRPGGVIKKLETRGDSLWIEAQLNLKIGYVNDIYEAAKMNDGLSFSVGFYLEEFEWVEKKGGESYLLIKQGELEEVSVVTFPGNENATMQFIKSADGTACTTIAEFEKHLVASGLVKSRNEAHALTLAVKKNAVLFRQDEAPVLASTQALDALSKALSAAKAALSS